MTDTYVPLIQAPAADGGFSNTNVITLQEQIHDLDVTHVRTKQGKIWKIFSLLNKKSVPLNNGGDGPQRVNFGSVESFGVMQQEEPENIPEDIPTDGDDLAGIIQDVSDTVGGLSIRVTPSPRGPGEVTSRIIDAAKKAGVYEGPALNADGNPVNDQGVTFGEHLQDPDREVGSWTPATVTALDTVAGEPFPEAVEGGEEQEAPAAPGAHQDRAHAILSASGAHRWINCTPSARLEEHLPDSTSEAAEQGTAAHELAEWKLFTYLGNAFAGPRPVSHWHDEEMEDHTDQYVDHVTAELARTKETSPAAFLSIEERLDFSHLVEDGFGTGDALIVGDGTMTIVDLKYGKGVEVSAVENPQMMLYALGALNTYGMIYDIHTVRMVIYQPRRHNISVWETSVTELLDWAEQVVKPAAQLAYAGEGELRAGEWCQFCRHAPQCTALAAQHFQAIPEATTTALEQKVTPPPPDTLSDEQIAQIVRHSGDIKKWLTSVEKHAQEQANTGRQYPGLKLVEGRSVRRYGDEDAIAQAVTAAGHDPYERKLISITAMTKLLGKKQFDELVGGHLTKPAGAPTLVPETDKRPALTVASPETVFQIIEETA